MNTQLGVSLSVQTRERLAELFNALQLRVPPGGKSLNRSALVRALIDGEALTESGIDAAAPTGRAGMVTFTVPVRYHDQLDRLARSKGLNRSRTLAALIETAHQRYITKTGS